MKRPPAAPAMLNISRREISLRMILPPLASPNKTGTNHKRREGKHIVNSKSGSCFIRKISSEATSTVGIYNSSPFVPFVYLPFSQMTPILYENLKIGSPEPFACRLQHTKSIEVRRRYENQTRYRCRRFTRGRRWQGCGPGPRCPNPFADLSQGDGRGKHAIHPVFGEHRLCRPGGPELFPGERLADQRAHQLHANH